MKSTSSIFVVLTEINRLLLSSSPVNPLGQTRLVLQFRDSSKRETALTGQSTEVHFSGSGSLTTDEH